MRTFPSSIIFALLLVIPLAAGASNLFVTDNDPRLTPASISVQDQYGFVTVFIDGYIHLATARAFEENATIQNGAYGIVVLNSAGGDVHAAMRLGNAIREKGFATQIGAVVDDVIKPGICESACPIAFLGGRFRILDTDTGSLRVHRFYKAAQGDWASDSRSLFDTERELSDYLEEMGVSLELLGMMKRTPPEQMRTIPKDSAYYWDVSTGREQNDEVVGISDSTLGSMKIRISCTANGPQVETYIKPWFPAEALLNFDQHSLTLNDVTYPVAAVKISYQDADQFLVMTVDSLESGYINDLRTASRIGYLFSFENGSGQHRVSMPSVDVREKIFGLIKECTTAHSEPQAHEAMLL